MEDNMSYKDFHFFWEVSHSSHFFPVRLNSCSLQNLLAGHNIKALYFSCHVQYSTWDLISAKQKVTAISPYLQHSLFMYLRCINRCVCPSAINSRFSLARLLQVFVPLPASMQNIASCVHLSEFQLIALALSLQIVKATASQASFFACEIHLNFPAEGQDSL